MTTKELNAALAAIAKSHPLNDITDREALDTALWFGSSGMYVWAREHQETHPEVYLALEYVTAMKADSVLLGKTVDAGGFIEGLNLLMDEARRDIVFGARISPTFYNVLCSGREVNIPNDQIEALAQLIDEIGTHWGFTLARIGKSVVMVPAHGVTLPA